MAAVLRCTVLVVGLMFAAACAADDPFGAGWPAGPNREVTGAFCGSCHSLALVRQQRQTRAGWDKLLTWMSETQNMPVVAPALRSMILDYLEFNFGVGALDQASLVDSANGLQGGVDPALIAPAD